MPAWYTFFDPLWLTLVILAILITGFLHLYHRPELNDGKMLSQLQSYVGGVGIIYGVTAVAILVRGAESGDWEYAFRTLFDFTTIIIACALPTWGLRKVKPFRSEQEKQKAALKDAEDRAAMAEIMRQAEEQVRAATSSQSNQTQQQ